MNASVSLCITVQEQQLISLKANLKQKIIFFECVHTSHSLRYGKEPQSMRINMLEAEVRFCQILDQCHNTCINFSILLWLLSFQFYFRRQEFFQKCTNTIHCRNQHWDEKNLVTFSRFDLIPIYLGTDMTYLSYQFYFLKIKI